MRKSLFVWLLLATTSVFGQDTLVHSYAALKFGLNNIQHKDLFQSPFTYKGNIPAVEGEFLQTRPASEYRVGLFYTGGALRKTNLPSATNSLSYLTIDYYYKPRASAFKRLTIMPGVGLHAFGNKINYLPELSSSQFNLSAGAFVTANLKSTFNVGARGKLIMEVSAPLAGYVYRPDFEINGQVHSSFTAPGNGLWSGSVQYKHAWTKRLSLTVTYRYNYFHDAQPRPIHILQNGLSIGLQIRL